MSIADVETAVPAGRPIELPATETTTGAAPVPSEDETAAQSTDTGEAVAEEAEFDGDVLPDYRGTDFDHDMGGSFAPVFLFSALAGLAVLLGVYATTALPVQIGAGLIAVGAGALAVSATARRRSR